MDSIKKKQSYEKLKDRKPKNIELEYPFKKPQFYPDLEKFWDLAIRDRKL